ncbi:MAG: hypothetical protein M1830_007391 [Pleopsidium flavum]|nr:MAG: hypothetical protein M1830_007391 [Pleopsidium flavum]
MDPLTPTTSTLSPAISHIAETAASLARSLQERTASSQDTDRAVSFDADRKEKQRQLVQWVLDAPRRLGAMVEDRKKDGAEAQWAEVALLLDKWKGVQGVNEVRRQCEKALKSKHHDVRLRALIDPKLTILFLMAVPTIRGYV